MGIKKLNSFLYNLNLINEFDSLNDLILFLKNKYNKEYFYFTIDTSLYLYKYIRACKLNNNLDFIMLFKNQIIKLLRCKIIPIYIFDGDADDLKFDTINKRVDTKNIALCKLNDLSNIDINLLSEDEKNKYQIKMKKLSLQTTNISSVDIKKLQYFLKSVGVPYIISPCESDIVCSKLVQCGYADACLSEDMDIFIYGCPILIKSTSKKYYVYIYDEIINKLHINSEHLCKFATLLGSDYSRSVNTKLSPCELLEICRNNNFNIKHILDKTINIDIHKKFYINDTIILSLSELSSSVCSNIAINDIELMKKIYKYYELAFELLNHYNLDNDIINLLDKINDVRFFSKNSYLLINQIFNSIYDN
jgi:5'-3' exonuclease